MTRKGARRTTNVLWSEHVLYRHFRGYLCDYEVYCRRTDNSRQDLCPGRYRLVVYCYQHVTHEYASLYDSHSGSYSGWKKNQSQLQDCFLD